MGRTTFEELIERKRDGGEHTAEDLDRIVLGYAAGEVPDYQMSAWLMAVCLNGMNADETVWLTDAMVRSGRVVDLSTVPGVKVDKHSTGGVADTTTLVVAPLVAACGAPVAKMSGRGLGHTGGTLDKLESIPGFEVELSESRFVGQVKDHGIAVIAQSPDIDPADKAIYALRDVTGTVPSVPLIVSSIMSKKVAGGADAIVLDVKVGRGAFMRSREDARLLASELVRVGRAFGRDVSAMITNMDQPLGMAIGNALEVREAVQTLSGAGPAALVDVCLELSARMLVHAGLVSDRLEGRTRAEKTLSSGAALAKFEEWVEAQGGDARVAREPGLLELSARRAEARADRDGFISGLHADELGRAAAALGAGRTVKDEEIDFGAGLELAVRIGDEVRSGQVLATLYAADDARLAAGLEWFSSAVDIAESPGTSPPLFEDA